MVIKEERQKIVVNYRNSQIEVSLKATITLLTTTDNFGFLSRSPGVYYRDRVEETPKYKDWPTWVPTFDENSPRYRLANAYLVSESHPRALVYNASKGLPAYYILVPNPQKPILTVFGLAIGKVAKVVQSTPQQLSNESRPELGVVLDCFEKVGISSPTHRMKPHDSFPGALNELYQNKLYRPYPNNGDSDLGIGEYTILVGRSDPKHHQTCIFKHPFSGQNCGRCASSRFETQEFHFPDNWGNPPCTIVARFPDFPQALLTMTMGRIGCNAGPRLAPGFFRGSIFWPYSCYQPLREAVWRTMIGDNFIGPPDAISAPVTIGPSVWAYLVLIYFHETGKMKSIAEELMKNEPDFHTFFAGDKTPKQKRDFVPELDRDGGDGDSGSARKKARLDGNDEEGCEREQVKADPEKDGTGSNKFPSETDMIGWLTWSFLLHSESGKDISNPRDTILNKIDDDLAQAPKNSVLTAQQDASHCAKGKAVANDTHWMENESVESEGSGSSYEEKRYAAAITASQKLYRHGLLRQDGAECSKDQEQITEDTNAVPDNEGQLNHGAGLDRSYPNTPKKIIEDEETTTDGPKFDIHTGSTSDNPFHPHHRPWDIEKMHIKMAYGRNAFRTDTGFIGFGPLTTKPDDIVVIVAGSDLPLILRRHLDHYLLVGQSYVHGVMFGELFEHCPVFEEGSTAKIPLRPFEIR